MSVPRNRCELNVEKVLTYGSPVTLQLEPQLQTTRNGGHLVFRSMQLKNFFVYGTPNLFVQYTLRPALQEFHKTWIQT